MHIEEFIESRKRALDEFLVYWENEHAPEDYTLVMNEPEWEERFILFVDTILDETHYSLNK